MTVFICITPSTGTINRYRTAGSKWWKTHGCGWDKSYGEFRTDAELIKTLRERPPIRIAARDGRAPKDYDPSGVSA